MVHTAEVCQRCGHAADQKTRVLVVLRNGRLLCSDCLRKLRSGREFDANWEIDVNLRQWWRRP